MAFECSFQSLSYKSFANIPQKWGGPQAPWAPPLNPPQTLHLPQTTSIKGIICEAVTKGNISGITGANIKIIVVNQRRVHV